jgi:hypothetical protein
MAVSAHRAAAVKEAQPQRMSAGDGPEEFRIYG